jgi:hypothetical protein
MFELLFHEVVFIDLSILQLTFQDRSMRKLLPHVAEPMVLLLTEYYDKFLSGRGATRPKALETIITLMIKNKPLFSELRDKHNDISSEGMDEFLNKIGEKTIINWILIQEHKNFEICCRMKTTCGIRTGLHCRASFTLRKWFMLKIVTNQDFLRWLQISLHKKEANKRRRQLIQTVNQIKKQRL